MRTQDPSEIEDQFALLPPEAQLGLLERLVHRVRLAVAGEHEQWEQALSAMAADPEVRRELQQIESEFNVAEADGLEGQ
ncbi:conserved hypothetical protein [Verrucomicrobia bacterium]|nr:conserved hypothetical protein [Verrucomicrobiota bacterium]